MTTFLDFCRVFAEAKLYQSAVCLLLGGRGGDGTVERYHPEEDRWEVLDQRVGSEDQEYSAVILDRVV